PDVPDPDHYEHQYAHCDVLVIGAGPAGLAAARAAENAGARVIVCQQSPHFGTHAFGIDVGLIDDRPVTDWVDSTVGELASAKVTILSRTTAFGYYDNNLVGAVERVTDHLPSPPAHLPRQRMWMIRAKAVVLASGAIERGIAYANNDLPGTLLAGAALTYVKRYGVRLGTQAVVFANNDGAYGAALGLHEAGVRISAIVDVRQESQLGGALPARARATGLVLLPASVIARARGRLRVSSVDVVPRAGGAAKSFDCDVTAVSGGYSPAVHLFSQARGSLKYDAMTASFFPDASPWPIIPAGAVNGHFSQAEAIADGEAAAAAAVARAGLHIARPPPASPT